MTRNTSSPLTRRTFLGAAGLATLSFPALAQSLQKTGPAIMSPSETFGTVSPKEVGLNNDVEAKMVSYLQSQIDAGVVPGAFVAAVRNGKVFLEKSLGVYCNRTGREVPYDGRAMHPVHSVSKMISSTAIAMAWQDGLIDIDTPVMKYVPEFGCKGKEGITIRMLLSHAAGIPKAPIRPMNAITGKAWDACVAATCQKQIEWEPASRTRYHGQTGLLMAAEAVRRVSGNKTWNQICQERLYKPLGLSSLTFEQPPADLPMACVPRLADPAKQWQKQLSGFYGMPGAGLLGIPADFLKFLAFHCQKGKWNGKTLLGEKYWKTMHSIQFADRPNMGNWGLGMMIRGTNPKNNGLAWFGLREVTGPNIFTHAGTDVALAAGDPDSNIQVFFMVTDKPKTPAKATELRETVLATIFNALPESNT